MSICATSRAVKESTRLDRQSLVAEARLLIGESLSDPHLSLDDIAGRMYVSRRRLQRAFEECGSSFRRELTELRLTRAAELLTDEPQLTIEYVAETVGYCHPSHLAKAFRRHYGRSPKDFRSENRASMADRARAPVSPVRRPAYVRLAS